MIKKILIATFLLGVFGLPASSNPESEGRAAVQQVRECAETKRDVCVVFAATQIMTSVPILNHLFVNERDVLDEVIAQFEKASFRVSAVGRPDFRKFLAENAIWTMDYYNERFLSITDPDYSYERVRHFYAAYQLLRAAACDEMQNDPCTESSLWYVNNAQNKEYWGQIVDRFAMEEAQSVALVDSLFQKYEGRF